MIKDRTPAAILLGALLIAGTVVYVESKRPHTIQPEPIQMSELEQLVVPPDGVVLPVIWQDLGTQLMETEVIDASKFTPLPNSSKQLVITRENAGVILNSFWALGLGNKNPILEEGEMMDPRYGGAGRFASTAGWTIAQGDPMSHYSRHTFMILTNEQQALVDKVSKGIYRPCCDNSTHFPDCNHGMAMLGLLELMASQGVSENDMWEAALAVNTFWFSDSYETIRAYAPDTEPKNILGAAYSSASGYRKIAQQIVVPKQQNSGSGCGV